MDEIEPWFIASVALKRAAFQLPYFCLENIHFFDRAQLFNNSMKDKYSPGTLKRMGGRGRLHFSHTISECDDIHARTWWKYEIFSHPKLRFVDACDLQTDMKAGSYQSAAREKTWCFQAFQRSLENKGKHFIYTLISFHRVQSLSGTSVDSSVHNT